MQFLPLILLLTAQLAGAVPPTDPSATIDSGVGGKLTRLLNQKRYLEFERALPETQDLAGADRDFLSGILANRKNQITESLRLLEPLLVQPGSGPISAAQDKPGWLTLADDYVKSFQYGKAADAYARVLQQHGPSLSDQEKKDIASSAQIYGLMKDYPAQTMKDAGPFTVQARRNALGVIELPATMGGETRGAIIDTGANLTTLSLTRARQLGLKISEGTTPVAGMAGGLSQCHVAVIPRLQIGKAEIQNVAAIVMDDKQLYYAPAQFQIEAVIGYPVIAALGRVTFYPDDRIGVARSTNDEGAEMFMDELTPLVAARTGRGVHLFTLDTGATTTALYEPYWKENQEDFAGIKPGVAQVQGTGGDREVPAVNAAEVPLTFGAVSVVGRNISVLTGPHNGAEEFFYGNIGQDLLRPLRSYSLDFRAMRFEIDAGTNSPR